VPLFQCGTVRSKIAADSARIAQAKAAGWRGREPARGAAGDGQIASKARLTAARAEAARAADGLGLGGARSAMRCQR
jgi:hypothetical protein